MTIVRLEGGLFIHSPTVLSPTLRAAIDDLGTPQWIIGPNTIHYWWVGEWKRAFPNACVFLAPGIPKRAKRRVDYPFVTLDHDTAWPWCHQLKTWVIRRSEEHTSELQSLMRISYAVFCLNNNNKTK